MERPSKTRTTLWWLYFVVGLVNFALEKCVYEQVVDERFMSHLQLAR